MIAFIKHHARRGGLEVSMKTILALAIATSFLTFTTARAQTIDMGKLQCDELGRVYLDQFAFVDAWLSGYYHAKSNKTVVDLKQIAANTRKVLQFCKSNPTMTVMQAIERLKESNG
jgi:acid stress chaperone HdeB